MFKQSKRSLTVLVTVLAVALVSGGLALAKKPPQPPPEPPPPESPADPAIAFVLTRKEKGWSIRDLMVMNADGTNVTTLLYGTDSQGYRSPSWSPDLDPNVDGYQGKLAVILYPNRQIILVDVAVIDGTPTALLPWGQLTSTDIQVAWWEGPDWSPDGKSIAFTAWDPATNKVSVRVIPADGSDTTGLGMVVFETAHGISRPTWSPDGTMIAFATGLVQELGSLLVDDADPATPPDPVIISESGYADLAYPAWSNSAAVNQIAFQGPESDSLALVDAVEGSTPVKLSDDTYAAGSWSPDDRFLVVWGEHDGRSAIIRLEVDTLNKTVLDRTVLFAPKLKGGASGPGRPAWRPDAQPMLP